MWLWNATFNFSVTWCLPLNFNFKPHSFSSYKLKLGVLWWNVQIQDSLSRFILFSFLSDGKARKPRTRSWPQGGSLISGALLHAGLHWRAGAPPQSVRQFPAFCLCSRSSWASHLGFQAPGFSILSFSSWGPWETLADSQSLCPAPGSGIGCR